MLVGFDMSSWNDIVECDSFYYWPSSLSDKLAVNQTDLVSNNCKNPVSIFSALSYVMLGHLEPMRFIYMCPFTYPTDLDNN